MRRLRHQIEKPLFCLRTFLLILKEPREREEAVKRFDAVREHGRITAEILLVPVGWGPRIVSCTGNGTDLVFHVRKMAEQANVMVVSGEAFAGKVFVAQ